MAANKVVFIGEKESFIVRVLVNKVTNAGVKCDFVQWTVAEINANIEEVPLIVLYLEAGIKPNVDVLHFLADRMVEKDIRLIIIGELADVQYVYDNMPGDLIYRTFSRPVNNDEFTEAITDYFAKASSGEFKKRVLIVDDDPQYLTLVREWLKGSYKVFMANSGLQAIKMLGKNKVDLILLDHEMPVTSGPQVLEMLRSDPDTASIPVIFLTGKGDKKSVMAVVALKPEGYFLKGIQKDELLEKLQEYFVLHK